MSQVTAPRRAGLSPRTGPGPRRSPPSPRVTCVRSNPGVPWRMTGETRDNRQWQQQPRVLSLRHPSNVCLCLRPMIGHYGNFLSNGRNDECTCTRRVESLYTAYCCKYSSLLCSISINFHKMKSLLKDLFSD